jgi:uncharacterized protein YbjT (DUF2867 family)
MPFYKENTSIAIEKQNESKPRILILGSSGRIGSKATAELERINSVQVVYTSRNLNHVDDWRRNRERG